MTKRRLTDDEVSRLPLGAARAELMEEIMRAGRAGSSERRERDRGRGWLPVLGAAAAVALLAGAAFVVPGLGRDGGGSGGTGLATSTAPAASAAPASREWVLLEAPGWTVAAVMEDEGMSEVQFEREGQSLDVTLYPARVRAEYVEDRSLLQYPARDPGTQVRVLGGEGLMWPYSDLDHTTIGAAEGGLYPEVRGFGMGRDAYLALLRDLVWVDRATFQEALPEDVFVADADREAVTAEMLSDMTVPDGLVVESTETDRYHLGADVAGAVACAWLDRFAEAKENGDQSAAQEASKALAQSREWAVLQEMAGRGDYPETVWQLVAQVQRGEVPDSYDEQLGCP